MKENKVQEIKEEILSGRNELTSCLLYYVVDLYYVNNVRSVLLFVDVYSIWEEANMMMWLKTSSCNEWPYTFCNRGNFYLQRNMFNCQFAFESVVDLIHISHWVMQ